jgi:hypothetical protein
MLFVKSQRLSINYKKLSEVEKFEINNLEFIFTKFKEQYFCHSEKRGI